MIWASARPPSVMIWPPWKMRDTLFNPIRQQGAYQRKKDTDTSWTVWPQWCRCPKRNAVASTVFCRDPSICRTPCSAQPVFWRKSPVRSRSWRHRRWRNRRYGISKSFPYQSTPCWPSSSPTPAEWRSICSTFPSCRTPRCCRIWSTKSTRSAPAFL